MRRKSEGELTSCGSEEDASGMLKDHWFQAEGEIKTGSSSVDLGANPALGGISKHTGKCFCGVG